MILQVCYFTKQGEKLAHTIEEKGQTVLLYKEPETPLEDWVEEGFSKRIPLLFIGAAGIAVRFIAPFVKDKLTDSAVLVMDEKGQYVIPLLAGHMGGANELAKELAGMLNATPVITTATDVEHVFSVDVFARNNGFRIRNREGIRAVSAKLLRKEEVAVAIDPQILVETPCRVPGLQLVPFTEGCVDIRLVSRDNSELFGDDNQLLCLVAKEYVCGIGCKKGKSFENLQEHLTKHCDFDPEEDLFAIASIDLKAKEPGLMVLASYYHVPLLTYSAETLNELDGDFSTSDFVKEITGVTNVCERAAMACSDGPIILQKIAEDGMTIATARRKPRISVWETN